MHPLLPPASQKPPNGCPRNRSLVTSPTQPARSLSWRRRGVGPLLRDVGVGWQSSASSAMPGQSSLWQAGRAKGRPPRPTWYRDIPDRLRTAAPTLLHR